MSKCDIHIVFDKRDRQFRGGDTVSGKVIVGVNKDVNCRDVVICGYWKTHGRGNRDQQEYQEQSVFQGEMKAGESYEFPYSITAPHQPVTYRGKLINIDHYVRVRVDIPWAIDPKQEDEFILLPGPVAQSEIGQTQAAEHALTRPAGRLAGFVITAVIFVVFFVAFLPRGGFGWFFLIIIAIVLVGFAFRGVPKALAERRLGLVSLAIDDKVVAPGGNVPVKLSFTPTRRGSIRGVTASLTGKESAISGSGTSKTTHRHTISQHTVTLDGPTEFVTGKPAEYSGVVPIPETNAFSFDTGANSVTWKLAVKVDMPRWPDWVDSTDLQLVPAEYSGGRVSESSQTGFGSPIIDAEIVDTMEKSAKGPTVEQKSSAEIYKPRPDDQVKPESPDAIANTSPTLLEAVGLLSKLDRYSDDHDRILDALKFDAFDISVQVERIITSYERFEDSAYDGGKTISGVISGTDYPVQINMTRESNQRVSQLHAGDTWQGRGRVVQWDSLYGRLEILGE